MLRNKNRTLSPEHSRRLPNSGTFTEISCLPQLTISKLQIQLKDQYMSDIFLFKVGYKFSYRRTVMECLS